MPSRKKHPTATEALDAPLKPRTDAEEKSLRGFKRLTSHPRLKPFVGGAEFSASTAEDGSKRQKK